MFKTWFKRSWLLVEISVIGLAVLTNFLKYVHFQKIMGNSASRLLLTLGPSLNLGRPYTDLWERLPPGFLIVSDAWIAMFGWSMNSLRTLQAVTIATIGICFVVILRKVYTSILLEIIITASTLIILFSPLIQTDILSIELFGLLFSLLGLVALLYIRQTVGRLVISAFLFFMASQMKETLTFSILAMVPLYFWLLKKEGFHRWLTLIAISMLGPLIALGLIVSYLFFVDGWTGYLQVFADKFTLVRNYRTLESTIANFQTVEFILEEHFLRWHNFIWRLGLLNLVLWSLQFVRVSQIKVTNAQFSFLMKIQRNVMVTWEEIAVACFAVGIIGGLVMYGEYSVDVRLTPVIPALMMAIGLLLKWPTYLIYTFLLTKTYKVVAMTVVSLMLIALLTPQNQVINSFFSQISYHVRAKIFDDMSARIHYQRTSGNEINTYINQNTQPTDCIMNLYGWEVAETYIYSQRRPCTRVFLANLLPPRMHNSAAVWQVEEYQQQVWNSPPKAIVYNDMVETIDLNVPQFEQNIINYSKMIQECYVLDVHYQKYPYLIGEYVAAIDLFWARPELSNEELKTCVKQYGLPTVSY